MMYSDFVHVSRVNPGSSEHAGSHCRRGGFQRVGPRSGPSHKTVGLRMWLGSQEIMAGDGSSHHFRGSYPQWGVPKTE
jgi:hypothetical protein